MVITRFRVVVGLVAAVTTVGLWATTAWSLVPRGLDARVVEVRWHSDSGLRFQEIHLDDGRVWVVDRALGEKILGASRSGDNSNVTKAPGALTLRVGEKSIDLGLSRAWWETTLAIALLGTATIGRSMVRDRDRSADPSLGSDE